ncbi:uncharacterized protein CC84DRAFT_321189 [Paraphaeosphaeria sporulosa]|uniref:Uncharacterized protein n=1 Tax=Paraphaeosphaeria sporulosa TaxID=1460663 RepID=A0A177C0A0_9PLEO|nr:uncharacterized protein CC84DRAFT_321189 [Paraphaeosphaeria sporulosa]OAG00661.1 hypothetical protein CC84DRAFT_321189 [Paraphaeosphaeria sporulosa]
MCCKLTAHDTTYHLQHRKSLTLYLKFSIHILSLFGTFAALACVSALPSNLAYR